MNTVPIHCPDCHRTYTVEVPLPVDPGWREIACPECHAKRVEKNNAAKEAVGCQSSPQEYEDRVLIGSRFEVVCPKRRRVDKGWQDVISPHSSRNEL